MSVYLRRVDGVAPLRIHALLATPVGLICEGVRRVMSGELTGYTLVGPVLSPGLYRVNPFDPKSSRREIMITGPNPVVLKGVASLLAEQWTVKYDRGGAVLVVPS